MNKNNMPELRFPEFQGDGEWEEKKLGEIVSYVSSKIDASLVAVENYVSTENMLSDKAGVTLSKSLPTSRVTHYVKEDILLSNIRPYLKKIWLSNKVGGCSADVLCLRAKENIYSNFLFCTISNDSFFDFAMHTSKGTKMPRGDKGKILQYMLCIPSILEQQKIADCLSSFDDVIHAQTQKIEKLTAHKKGLLQKLFPQEGQSVPEFRFPEFRGCREWEEVTLGEYTIKIGSGITPRGGEKNYKKEGRPFVRSQNVGWGELLLKDVVYITDEVHSTFSSTEIFANDVLLNITGASIGRCSLASKQIAGGNVNQHVCIIRVKEDVLHSNFTMQYIISKKGQKQIDSFQAGGNRQGLNFAQIRSLKIPLPSFDEQQKIADCLSSLDSLILQHTKKLDALKKHKQGLMQGLFPSG